jgi:hypothetical protein
MMVKTLGEWTSYYFGMAQLSFVGCQEILRAAKSRYDASRLMGQLDQPPY